MSNMSYCRFENTSNDLADCVGVMQEADSFKELTEDMNEYERDAYARMKQLCKDFLEEDARLKPARADVQQYDAWDDTPLCEG